MKEANISLSCFNVLDHVLSTCVQLYTLMHETAMNRVNAVLQTTIQVLAAFIPDGISNINFSLVIKTVV